MIVKLGFANYTLGISFLLRWGCFYDVVVVGGVRHRGSLEPLLVEESGSKTQVHKNGATHEDMQEVLRVTVKGVIIWGVHKPELN